jgi:hypothetical protein
MARIGGDALAGDHVTVMTGPNLARIKRTVGMSFRRGEGDSSKIRRKGQLK